MKLKTPDEYTKFDWVRDAFAILGGVLAFTAVLVIATELMK